MLVGCDLNVSSGRLIGLSPQSADMIINDQDHALAAVGPIHELPDYNWIRRRSYWLRQAADCSGLVTPN